MHASHQCVRLKSQNFSLSLWPRRVSSCTSTFLSVFPFSSPHFLCCCSVSSPFTCSSCRSLPAFLLRLLFWLGLLITAFILPVCLLQDGSCNGLQHYAALGRDVIGATSVNLMPCEVPQDVYSGVAQQVSRAALFLSGGRIPKPRFTGKLFKESLSCSCSDEDERLESSTTAQINNSSVYQMYFLDELELCINTH